MRALAYMSLSTLASMYEDSKRNIEELRVLMEEDPEVVRDLREVEKLHDAILNQIQDTMDEEKESAPHGTA